MFGENIIPELLSAIIRLFLPTCCHTHQQHANNIIWIKVLLFNVVE